MQPQRAEALQQDGLPEHSQPTIGGADSQLSEAWSQMTEPLDEAGEIPTAMSLGRVKDEVITGDDDGGAARRLGEQLAQGEGSRSNESRGIVVGTGGERS